MGGGRTRHGWLVAGWLLLALLACALIAPGPAAALQPAHHAKADRHSGTQPESTVVVTEPRALNGSGNNAQHPEWGEAGSRYVRFAPAHYADGISQPVTGPNPRYISNRVFNALGTDLFSRAT